MSNEDETIDTAAVGASVVTSTESNSKRSGSSSGGASDNNIVKTIIFDVDDTLYDVASGFTIHRQGEVIYQYMVDHLQFKSIEEAKIIRDKYFKLYHSTGKALTVAQSEDELPVGAPTFDIQHMAQYWVDHLNYNILWGCDSTYASTTKKNYDKLKKSIKIVAFSNGPRSYVVKVLKTLQLWDLFGSNEDADDGKYVFGVDDVLPYCKPEKESFEKIFDTTGKTIRPEECIMVEDSMKNIRAAKALGMKTILITGSSEDGRDLSGDAPSTNDPAVDIAFQTIEEMKTKLPGLWQNPSIFEPY
ncbi:HAD-like protein [Fragilariopsis cylindrus CCMP1102]|uniref:HAD-like protein n=1 Tax=Fragilariopsis cylindrus CCMP1102 TaxID=635003 RepID=A0A1E7FLJ3_9STRA|nr:HAD-like protein [Fragilariopsis cylindrus CCMP1102]|eukprot:OEU19038.1 HAD-like protein [Fragilariopsis cylindrus CCMP1102]